MMSSATAAVVLFLLFVSAQRLLETFAKRPIEPGIKRMGWSFYAFFILHTLILLGALAEHWWWRGGVNWWWSAAGLALYVASVVLRNVAIRALGKFWSLHIEIRGQHRLVREGIYNVVRHPAYAAIILEVFSIPLVANAWWTMLFAAVTYVPLLVLRMRREEAALVEKFGREYVAYQHEVGALVPKLSALRPASGAPRSVS